MSLSRFAAAVLVSALLAATGCGNDSCDEANEVQNSIRSAAAVDFIDANGLCDLSDDEIRAEVDGAPSVPAAEKPARADQYVKACRRFRELMKECAGD